MVIFERNTRHEFLEAAKRNRQLGELVRAPMRLSKNRIRAMRSSVLRLE